MKLIPASSAPWMIPMDSPTSGLPHSPNIMAPRHSVLTFTPVAPSLRYSMSREYPFCHQGNAGGHGDGTPGLFGVDHRDESRRAKGPQGRESQGGPRMGNSRTVEEWLDVLSIREVISRYTSLVNRDAWDEFDAL